MKQNPSFYLCYLIKYVVYVRIFAIILLIMLIISVIIAPIIYNLEVIANAEAVNENIDRSKLLMLFIISMVLSDLPLENVERYELLNTLYIYRNGSLRLINEPFLPGDLVLNLTVLAKEIKNSINNGTITCMSNETGVYMKINGEIVGGFEFIENGSWSLFLEPLYSESLNDNSLIYWRKMYVNYTDRVVEYRLLHMVQNISQTHRIHVATICEVAQSGDRYSYVFTLAIYWFKNKTVFFGDWIILPDGADDLEQYFELVAYGVKWLSINVYKGTSPGYSRGGSYSNYSPTAYPQIAKALELLANNIPEEYNLLVEKGYALILDLFPLITILAAVITGAITGAVLYTIYWAITTDCDINRWNRYGSGFVVAVGTVSGF